MTASTSTRNTKVQAAPGSLFSHSAHPVALSHSGPASSFLPRHTLRWTLTACAFAVLSVTAHPAWADGGAGGASTGAGGTGGEDSVINYGGNGDSGTSLGDGGGGGGAGNQIGGTGGTGSASASGGLGGIVPGEDGHLGEDATSGGGGGGGGGAHGGVVTVDNSSNAGTIKGGAGGNGGAGATVGGAGGGGGAGGYGVVLDGDGLNYTNSGSITGGKGGDGGSSTTGGNGGNGGSGGTGFVFTNGGTLENTSSGAISGGKGGTGGTASGGTPGANGSGGAGIVGANISITNSGTISGGMGGDGTTQADALRFTGGDNFLTLEGSGWHLNGNIDIQSGTLTFMQTTDQEVSNTITGTGALILYGGGTLTLTGSNTYTGETWIDDGTLALSGTGSIASSSNVDICDCGTLDISATNDGATLQSLSGGDGGVVILGDKTLTLSGNANGAYEGSIEGAGGLVISDGGTEYLHGDNSYQGGTFIGSEATVSVGKDTSLGTGTVTISDSAYLIFDADSLNLANNFRLNGTPIFWMDSGHTETLSGTIGDGTSTGSLLMAGDGTLVLTNINTYTGPTSIASGTLALSGAGSIASSSGVDLCDCATFDISATNNGTTIQSLEGEGTVMLGGKTLTLSNASGVYSGVIQGVGGSLAINGGSQILNGVNTYTGGTTVNAGTLEVGDADHPSASIQGNVAVNDGGTLRGHGSIAGNVDSTGTVWPGGSIGTLTVNGNYTQSPNGTLQIEVSPTEASQLKVAGTASLAGTLSLLYAPGTYTSRNYPILSAKAVNGTFSNVTANNPTNVEYKILYDALGVNLDVTALVIAPTQATIFGAMGSSALRAGQAANDILLSRLTDPCLASGAGHTAGGSNGTVDTLDSDSRTSSASGLNRDAAPSSRLDCSGPQNDGLWIQAQGTDTRIDGNHNAPDVRDRRYGFLAGFDHTWRGMTVGLAGGYSHGDISESGNGSNGKLDTLRLAGYAAKNLGAYTLASTLGYAYDFASTTRSFGALGKAKGDGHGQELTAGLQASRAWQIGPATTLTPRIGLRYAYLDGLGTSESGPTAQNLGVGKQHLQSLQPYVGLTLDYAFTLPNSTRPASVQLRAGYAYETLSTGRNTSVTAADGTGFTIAGTRDSRGQLTAGLGATLPLGKTTRAYLRYDAWLHIGNVNAQSLRAGVDYRF